MEEPVLLGGTGAGGQGQGWWWEPVMVGGAGAGGRSTCQLTSQEQF